MTDKAPEASWPDVLATHTIQWLREGYTHCQHGTQEWCERYLNNAATALEAAQAHIKTLQEIIQWAHDTLYEINPSNYDHDEVCRLNDASVEVILGLAPLLGERHGKIDEWWSARAEALEEAAKAADDFSWVLPFYGKPDVDEATDDCAEAVCEQLAAAIRALKGETHGD